MADKSTAYGSTQPLVGAPNGIVTGQWKNEMFGCFTDCWPNCAMSFFCPCVSLAQTLHRVGIYSYTVALLIFGSLWILMDVADGMQLLRMEGDDPHTWGAYDSWSLVYAIFGIINVILVMKARSQIRQMFQIEGSCCEDFWCTLCCQCCVIAQMATHVEAYNKGECNFGPKDTLPGYTV